MSVSDWQFELDGLLFGDNTPYLVYDFEHGKPDARANDAVRPRADGMVFGRDDLAGMPLTWEIGVVGSGPSDVLEKVAAMRGRWYGDEVRATPGAVSVLRMRRPGRGTVRVYGRPRSFAPATLSNVASGYVPVVCDFQAQDGYFYSDAELATTVGIVPPTVGGLSGALIGPIVSSAVGEGVTDLFVGGDVPGWLAFRINGPIVDPTVEVVDQWSATLRVSLASDQWLVVDPTPWNRGVRRSDGANLAGVFTAASQRLQAMRIPPGRQQILLRGTDATGTATVQVFVREANSSY